MPKTDDSTKTPSTDTAEWAKKFALRLQKVKVAEAPQETGVEKWPTDALEMLWAMFDEAIEQAQRALEEYGIAERIVYERGGHDYRLRMTGPDGKPRQIAVFANVAVVGGHISGGSHISTSQTRATIYLVPSLDGDHLHWIVEATGKEFTPRVLDDLFLSVFSDDPAATRRLASQFTSRP